MSKEIDRAGLPIVQVANLTKIALGVGSNRVLQGAGVMFPLGNPSLPPEIEQNFREDMIRKALNLLTKNPVL